MPLATLLTLVIVAASVAGVLLRPRGWPEAIWAVLGALALLLTGLIEPASALAAVLRGHDVYLFLAGMMLLSELARREGLFDWIAAHAANAARGSVRRLYWLVYGVGVLVTGLLSNDATAVVLTPAVLAVARTAGAEALPLLYACALVANAASFLLPISNPANIVLYGDHTPPLLPWLASFALPSLAAILATGLALYALQRRALAGRCAVSVPVPRLGPGGAAALLGLLATALALTTVSALDRPLGAPTALLGALTAAVVLLRKRESPLPLLRGVAWSVMPLVAGLFVLVAGLAQIGVVDTLATALRAASDRDPAQAAAIAGSLLAFGSNVVNNLPAGLLAASAIHEAAPPGLVVDALLIGVDLGPNLSVTGSLATILWLLALRREGRTASFVAFLKIGAVVMPAALLPALALRLWLG